MRKTNDDEYRPDTVSHPGGTLADFLEERGMSQAELAERTGRPKKTINEIVKGKNGITPETALQLERVLGAPASFWNKRQSRYDEYSARLEEESQLERHLSWLKKFPVKEMVKYGYIKDDSDKLGLLQNLLNFFGVASPTAFENRQPQMAAQFRKSAAFKTDEFALAAWLRLGQVQASRISSKKYNRAQFVQELWDLRGLTRENPEVFVPKLKDICAGCGVAVVFVPEMPKIRTYGATYWMNDTPVIQLCLRGKKDDILWFTFFHEAGHVVLHGKKKTIYLEVNKKEGGEELQANSFASEMLIPRKSLDLFVARHRPHISKSAIVEFADEMGVSTGIVAGQLHHFNYADFKKFQGLKKTLAWRTS
jgi:HTH-type transcriptional regulator / antitoxin HigA